MRLLKPFALGLFLLVLLLAGIKRDSLWIDEAETANYALQPTFSDWKHVLLNDAEANCQFPLYMLGIWSWEKITGSSEYALRSFNIVFALLAFASLYLVGRELKLRGLWAILLIQPFFWFYLNEARPYMIQLGAGSVLLAGLVLIVQARKSALGWWLFVAGTILLYYATLLSFVTLTAYYLAAGALLFSGKIRIPKNWPLLLGILILALLPGAIYYIETVVKGAQGARYWAVSPLNYLWVYYELIGAIGLGPPIFEIREIAHTILHSGTSYYLLVQFLPAGLLCGCLLLLASISGLRYRYKFLSPNIYSLTFLVFLLSSLVFVFLSVLLHKAFWARHLAPLFPIYCLLLYGGISRSISAIKEHKLTGCLAVAIILLLAYSTCSYLFSETYLKDDNRQAASLVLKTLRNGKKVWWAAAYQCGWYYGLPISKGTSVSPNLVFLESPSDQALSALNPPDLIFLNERYDIFDATTAVRNFAEGNGYRKLPVMIQTFSVWGRTK